jgi:hypothetical protein
MNNLFDYPHLEDTHEKHASGGPDELIVCLISGDPEKLASVMNDEDRAYWAMREDTIAKLASMNVTEGDVEGFSDTDIVAIKAMGGLKEATEKVAQYAEFYHATAEYERAGRGQARQALLKLAMAAEASELQAIESVQDELQTKDGPAKVASAAAAELERRGLVAPQAVSAEG